MMASCLVMAGLFISTLVYIAESAQTFALVVVAALALLYSFRLLPAINNGQIKDIALWKLGILAGSWTLATTLPALPADQWITAKSGWYLCCRFSFMLVLCIPFDVRDDKVDRPHMKKTLLQWFPATQLTAICWMLFGLFVMGMGQLWHGSYLSFYLAMLFVLHMFYCTHLAINAIRHPAQDGQYLWLDAQMLVQSIIVVGGCWWLA